MKKIGLIIFIILILIFYRSGLSFSKLKCKYILSPTTDKKNCDFFIKSDDLKVVMRVGKLTKSFKLGAKYYILYRFNTPISIVSHWGVLSVDKNKPVKVSVSSNQMLNDDPSWITFEETFEEGELIKYLNKEYFDCEACKVIDELRFFGFVKDNNIVRFIFPNYINLSELVLYEN